jgi:hypothetical protein
MSARWYVDHPSALPRRGRSALLWGLACFAAVQLGLIALLEHFRPQIREPEYGYRLRGLLRRRAAEPARPVVTLLGSSRLGSGFRPDILAAYCPGERPPLIHNCAQSGSGPVGTLTVLNRLLAQGVRPRAAVVEVLDPMLHQEGRWCQNPVYWSRRMTWGDLSVLTRYAPGKAGEFYRTWCEQMLVPCYSQRFALLAHALPSWLPQDSPAYKERSALKQLLDESGFLPMPPSVTPEDYRNRVQRARLDYFLPFPEHFTVSAESDRALRELLETCRRERIEVIALVLMPEGTDLRSWYPRPAWDGLRGYLRGLCSQYGTRLVDASCWLGDGSFIDGHHPTLPGAAAFSDRFGRDVLGPWWRQHDRGEPYGDDRRAQP